MKIRLREGCAADVERRAAELNRRSDEVHETLRAEGVALEAVFLDRQADGDHLIYVINASDFDRAAAVARASPAAIDAFHRAFKEGCWETRVPLRSLIDFDAEAPSAFTGDGAEPLPSTGSSVREVYSGGVDHFKRRHGDGVPS